MANEQIRIGVDYSEFSSGIQSIKSQAEALAQDMIRQASEQGKTGAAALDMIEKQIKALERRNQLESEVAKSELRQEYNAGNVGSKEFAGEMKEQRGIDQDQKLIVQLLKDLVQTTRDASRDAISQDKILADREDTRQDLGIGGGIAGASLIELVKSGDKKEGEQVENASEGRKHHGKGERLGESIRTSAETFFEVATAPNQYEGILGASKQIAGLIAAQGGVVGALGAIAGMTLAYAEDSFKKFAQYEAELIDAERVQGGGLGDFSGYGLNKVQALQEEKRVMRARGTNVNYGNATRESVELQKGYRLEQGSIYGLANILRSNTAEYGSYDKFGMHISNHDAAGESTSLRKWAEMAQGSAEESGVTKRGDTNILPEYLNVLIGIGREQLLITGEVNMGLNTKVLNSLTHLDNTFKNPEVLAKVYQGLTEGLKESSNPNKQAMQYSILSRMRKPDGSSYSMWEMEGIMERPMDNPEYMNASINMIKKLGGGSRENTLHQAKAYFPNMSNSEIERVIYGNWTGGDGGGMSPSRTAGAVKVDDIEVQEAERFNKKIEAGEFTKKKIDEMDEVLDNIKKSLEKVGLALGDIYDFFENLLKRKPGYNPNTNATGTFAAVTTGSSKTVIDPNDSTKTIVLTTGGGGKTLDQQQYDAQMAKLAKLAGAHYGNGHGKAY